MYNLTKETIWATIKADTEKVLGFPLMGDQADKEAIEELCERQEFKDRSVKGRPVSAAEFIRAMWMFYVTDPEEQGYGVSVEKFIRPKTMMRLAACVTSGSLKGGRSQLMTASGTPPEHTHYRCDRCGWRVQGGVPVDDPKPYYPLFLPDPCNNTVIRGKNLLKCSGRYKLEHEDLAGVPARDTGDIDIPNEVEFDFA